MTLLASKGVICVFEDYLGKIVSLTIAGKCSKTVTAVVKIAGTFCNLHAQYWHNIITMPFRPLPRICFSRFAVQFYTKLFCLKMMVKLMRYLLHVLTSGDRSKSALYLRLKKPKTLKTFSGNFQQKTHKNV